MTTPIRNNIWKANGLVHIKKWLVIESVTVSQMVYKILTSTNHEKAVQIQCHTCMAIYYGKILSKTKQLNITAAIQYNKGKKAYKCIRLRLLYTKAGKLKTLYEKT